MRHRSQWRRQCSGDLGAFGSLRRRFQCRHLLGTGVNERERIENHRPNGECGQTPIRVAGGIRILYDFPRQIELVRITCDGRKAADLYAALLAAEPHATAERKRELRTEAVKQARQSPLFFDLTISLSKSISIFHASLGENARLARQAGDREGDQYWSALVGEVDEMIWQAVHAGFGYFQREAGYTRTGSHNTRVHGRETGQWHEADLAVAHWLQHTSRDGDMQLHVHSQIAHTAKTGHRREMAGPGLPGLQRACRRRRRGRLPAPGGGADAPVRRGVGGAR